MPGHDGKLQGLPMTDHYDALETRAPAEREAKLFLRLPSVLRKAMAAPAYAERLKGIDPADITSRAALAGLPVLRKADLPALHKKAALPFGGLVSGLPGSFGRLFTSPGPIFEPEPVHADPLARSVGAVRRGLPAGRRGAEHLQLSPLDPTCDRT
jgi:phenylacetate-CoA ligase